METPAEFRERMRSISVARSGELVRVNAKEREWARDMAVFKTLVEQGYMPPQIDGCDERAANAKTAFDIEAA